jgi:hypothetical protein
LRANSNNDTSSIYGAVAPPRGGGAAAASLYAPAFTASQSSANQYDVAPSIVQRTPASQQYDELTVIPSRGHYEMLSARQPLTTGPPTGQYNKMTVSAYGETSLVNE